MNPAETGLFSHQICSSLADLSLAAVSSSVSTGATFSGHIQWPRSVSTGAAFSGHGSRIQCPQGPQSVSPGAAVSVPGGLLSDGTAHVLPRLPGGSSPAHHLPQSLPGFAGHPPALSTSVPTSRMCLTRRSQRGRCSPSDVRGTTLPGGSSPRPPSPSAPQALSPSLCGSCPEAAVMWRQALEAQGQLWLLPKGS